MFPSPWHHKKRRALFEIVIRKYSGGSENARLNHRIPVDDFAHAKFPQEQGIYREIKSGSRPHLLHVRRWRRALLQDRKPTPPCGVAALRSSRGALGPPPLAVAAFNQIKTLQEGRPPRPRSQGRQPLPQPKHHAHPGIEQEAIYRNHLPRLEPAIPLVQTWHEFRVGALLAPA
jgi:hypothetical protein